MSIEDKNALDFLKWTFENKYVQCFSTAKGMENVYGRFYQKRTKEFYTAEQLYLKFKKRQHEN